MTWKNGKVHFEEASTYHARKTETSASQTKDYIASVRGYFRTHYLGQRKQATAQMEFGSVVHEEALLDAILRSYVIIPQEVLSKSGSKAGAAWKQFEKDNCGRLLVKASEVETMDNMLDAVRSHPKAKGLFDEPDARKELTITADAEVCFVNESGELQKYPWPVRGRLDWVYSKIKDLKTTGDLSERSMRYKPFDLGWDVSAAYYRRLWHALTGDWLDAEFVVVESKEPFRVEIWSPKPQTLEAAELKIDEAHQGMFANWKDFAETKDENVWQRPGFDEINLF